MNNAQNPDSAENKVSDIEEVPTRSTTGADSDAETRAQTTWNTETGDYAAEQLSMGLNEVPGDKDMQAVEEEIRGPDQVPPTISGSFQEAEAALRDVDPREEIAKVANSKAETVSADIGNQAAGQYGITVSPASDSGNGASGQKTASASPLSEVLRGLRFPLRKEAVLERLRWQETLPMRPQESLNLHALLKDSDKEEFRSLAELEDTLDEMRSSIA